jgi:cyclic pyranopterin phosphate synthase
MKLTHLDKKNYPAMVDIAAKNVTRRTATAIADMRVPKAVAALMRDGDLRSAKGPVFHTAIIAGTQAVKDTSRLIPFCHPLPLDGCKFEIKLNRAVIEIRCTVSAEYKTGVEMEALTGASVAALTIYDMCKAVTHDMEITSVRLVEKSGGKRTVKAT